MSELKSHQELTAAGETAVGFEYQYYYFLYLILELKSGETIGLEIKDDIHIDYLDGTQKLMQLKHSVQTNADGKTINLRESDLDLWKTLFNWIKIISDKSEGRYNLQSQKEYIEKTEFILISNKADNTNNDFIVKLNQFKKKLISVIEFKEYFIEKYNKSSKDNDNNKISLYLKEIINQSDEFLDLFLNRIILELDKDDLINQIKERIKSKFIPENRIDDVFSSLDSNIRKDNYITIKKRDRIEYSFEMLYEKYTRCFIIGRTRKKIIRKSKIEDEVNLERQLFIKQLEEIEVISNLDDDFKEQVLKRSTAKLLTYNNIEQWKQDGEIVNTDIVEFNENSKYEWESSFDKVHNKLKRKLRRVNNSKNLVEEEIIDLANECLEEVMNKKLNFGDTLLDLEFSNGQYYLLSDRPEIGWRFDWEERYSK